MSNEVSSSSLMIKATGGGNIKRDKHSIHIMFGCKRSSCTTCFNGQPYQAYVNLLGRK